MLSTFLLEYPDFVCLLTFLCLHNLVGIGMEVVKEMSSKGSKSGKTSTIIKIEACGELPL